MVPQAVNPTSQDVLFCHEISARLFSGVELGQFTVLLQMPLQTWLGAVHLHISPERVKPFVQVKPQGLSTIHCGRELSGYVHCCAALFLGSDGQLVRSVGELLETTHHHRRDCTRGGANAKKLHARPRD